MRSSEGPAYRMEKRVAVSSPQEVTHLIIGREEIMPSPAPTLGFQQPDAATGLEPGAVPVQGARCRGAEIPHGG